MADDEERDFYEKYIKPQYTILKRIKRKIFKPKKRIKTIDDFDFLDYDLFIKLICVLMIYVILSMVANGLIDIYRWFFPVKEHIVQSPFFKYVSVSNWVLIANTGYQPMTDYYTLAVIMFALGWIIYGLVRIIRGSRKKESEKVYLEHRQLEGWSEAESFYLLNCPIHGPYEDYPHGFDGHFVCPKCLELRLIANG